MTKDVVPIKGKKAWRFFQHQGNFYGNNYKPYVEDSNPQCKCYPLEELHRYLRYIPRKRFNSTIHANLYVMIPKAKFINRDELSEMASIVYVKQDDDLPYVNGTFLWPNNKLVVGILQDINKPSDIVIPTLPECGICMQPIEDAQAYPQCGHIFCMHCISRNCTEKRFRCPNCNSQINSPSDLKVIPYRNTRKRSSEEAFY